MASSPLPEERPPLQNFRRSFTTPARQLSIHEKASLDKADASAEILYSHPHARIISFSPPKESIVSKTTAAIPPDTDYPVDTVETLPWRSRTETVAASGRMLIEKVRGSTNFLKCQDVMHAILRNSQCWCVDGESKFVLRVRKFQYYRIELPSVSEEDKKRVEELKLVLPTVLRYERTPCPFIRAFQVDLPDDAITPRRKGAWKRRDSSQPGTPETETPPIRVSKSTRSYSLRSPPSAYPTNGPGYIGHSPEYRPGSAASLYKRTSNLDSQIETGSPANLANTTRRQRRSEQEDSDSDHGSEPASDTEETTESPNEEDVRGRQGMNTNREARSISVSARVAAFETVRAESVSRTTKRPEISTRASVDNKQFNEAQGDSEAQVKTHEANEVSSLQPDLQTSSDVYTENDSDALPEVKPDEEPQQSDSNLQAEANETSNNQQESFEQNDTIDPDAKQRGLPELVEPETVQDEQTEEESLLSQDTNVASIHKLSTSVADATGTETSDTERSFEPIRNKYTLPENATTVISPRDGADGSENSGVLARDTEVLDQTSPRTNPDSDIDIEKHTKTEAVEEQDTETQIPSYSEETDQPEQASEDLAADDLPQSKLPQTEPAVVEYSSIDDDNMSTASSVDSFHTMSPTGSINTDFLQTPMARQLDPFSSPTQNHKRGTSEATIMTSTASDGGFDIETPLARSTHQLEEGVDGQALNGALSHAVTAAAAGSDPDSSLRRRLQAHRSFSPPPPASTIFTGTHPRHDTSHHMTKAILQKAIVKPVEMLVLVIHILSRIAGGATVSDLLSGELFRRPEHRRRVSGFADQLGGDSEEAELEDDYGIPIRGRLNKINQNGTKGESLGATSYGYEDDAESFISVD